MQEIQIGKKASQFLRAALVGLLFAVLYMAAPAVFAQSAQPSAAVKQTDAQNAKLTSAESEQLREQAKTAVFDKTVAEAKLEVIAAGNSRLEIWTGIYGILIAVLLFGFGIATYRRAAFEATKAAGEEFKSYKKEIQTLLETAKTSVGKIRAEHVNAVQLSQKLQELVGAHPSTAPTETPLPPEQHQELEQAAKAADEIPREQRTAQDFRILMYLASSERNWQKYVDLAEGMVYLHSDNPDDLSFALFGRAVGQNMLKNSQLAAIYWGDYWRRCPNDDGVSRADALNNWGTALMEQAKTKQGETADALFTQADEKYAAALDIKPDDLRVLKNWGTALMEQAQTKQGETADALFTQAGEKHAAALAIKPDDHWVLNSWGTALMEQAKTKQGEAADALFLQAEEKLLQAEAIPPGQGGYNLACLNGLRGDAAGAAQWLRKAKETSVNYPDCAHIAADPDFDTVRDAPEFVQALKDIGC